MNAPAISVVLPVYNCERYLEKAIQSVLDQTFTDFELIIINDGSTDKTEFNILSFTDHRIVYVKNPQNKGLIYSLNRGIEMAQGQYIARMDADDICLPERLEKQKNFLDEHPGIAMTACLAMLIDEKGREKGIRKEDKKTTSPLQIRRKMPYENCIAHPTVMMRSGVFKKLLYKPNQKNIEDYDCWLRLLNRGYAIQKMEVPLLLYRTHEESVTNVHLRKINFFLKHFHMKRRFLARELMEGRINGFTFSVIIAAALDIVKGAGKAIKNMFK
jgi:glycosyltransferase involved in cell wall biosynthesis